MKKKSCFPLVLGLLSFTVVSLVLPPYTESQEIMSWRLSKIYWRQNANNPHVRIIQNQADSRGGSIDLEHFPYDPGCREPAIKANYRWRFDKDISLLSGGKGDLAFIGYGESNADQGKGCWNVNRLLGWKVGGTNDFATYKSIMDRGVDHFLTLEGKRSMTVEVYFSSYIAEGYKGVFVVAVNGHGVSGGWVREAVYEFERAVGQPPDSRETFCDQYAKAAVSQNEENIRKGCGYRGNRWHANYKAHLNWCVGADKNAIDAERRGRNEDLRKCSGASIFTNPMSGGYRIDHCLTWGQQCDQPAADKFCRDKGFSGASTFRWEYVQPTKILGTGQICTGGNCGGFSYIECFEAKK